MRLKNTLLSAQAFVTFFVTAQSRSLRSKDDDGTNPQKMLKKVTFDCNRCRMSLGGPVCGEDGVSYQNKCLAWCQNVEAKSVGECLGHNSMIDETYDTISEISKEDIDRFKDEKFVFVAKRNFHKLAKKTNKDHDNLEKGEENINRMSAPMSNNNGNTEENIIYAYRITDEGHEYLAKYDLAEMGDDITGFSPPQLPLEMEYDNPRHLQQDNDEDEDEDGDVGETEYNRGTGIVGSDDESNDGDGDDNENYRGIVGSDSRKQVCHGGCKFPYTTIGQFDSGSKMAKCTGTIISPNSVITAAHCFYKDGHYTDIDRFSPGRYRDGSHIVDPYDIWAIQFKTIFTGWTSPEGSKNQKRRYDLALAHFTKGNENYRHGRSDDQPKLNIGEMVGYVGIAATTTASSRLQKATVTGYPTDKKKGEMWTSGSCSFQEGYEDVITYHNCDSAKGEDGSGLLHVKKKTLYGIDNGEVKVGAPYKFEVFVNIGVIIHKTNIGLIKAAAGLY